MNNQLKQISQLTRIGLFSWVKIMLLSIVSTVLSFILGVYYFFKSVSESKLTANDWLNDLWTIISSHLFEAFFLFLVFNSIWLLIYLANDYVTFKIIHKLISDNSEKILEPILEKSLASVKSKFPKLMQKGADFSMTKLKLIEEIKTSKENRFIKRIILFCLDQVYLADVDLSKENTSFEEILKIKIIQILKGITEPTRIWILLVILFQWLVVVFI
ncbi:MAG: hypothetical protein FGM14_01265 [Flavobacteriales bacterium]|nr:hypothetical protein [Flavobacteriales bacterium]